MSDKTGIAWTEATWNPTTGCAKVSQGCKHCYAECDWARLSSIPGTAYTGRDFTDVQCHEERLTVPLRWKRPRKIFVNSMSDLFHEKVPDQFIDQVFAVTAVCRRHTFQVLTKRPERMQSYLMDEYVHDRIIAHAITSARLLDDCDGQTTVAAVLVATNYAGDVLDGRVWHDYPPAST